MAHPTGHGPRGAHPQRTPMTHTNRTTQRTPQGHGKITGPKGWTNGSSRARQKLIKYTAQAPLVEDTSLTAFELTWASGHPCLTTALLPYHCLTTGPTKGSPHRAWTKRGASTAHTHDAHQSHDPKDTPRGMAKSQGPKDGPMAHQWAHPQRGLMTTGCRKIL
jgi:hypothetical protein